MTQEQKPPAGDPQQGSAAGQAPRWPDAPGTGAKPAGEPQPSITTEELKQLARLQRLLQNRDAFLDAMSQAAGGRGDEDKRRRPASLLKTDRAIDLRAWLRAFWRRRAVVVGIVVLMTALAAVAVYLIPSSYEGTAQVMIEPRRGQVVDVESALSGAAADVLTIRSEIEIIESRRLAERVVEQTKLNLDPEFNPALREPSPWAKLVLWLQSKLPLAAASGNETAAEAEALASEAVVTELLDHVRAEPVDQSRVIAITVESRTPRKASRLANVIADVYLVNQLEAKYEASKRATEWLSQRLAQLRQTVEITERAVEDFRQEAGLVKGASEAGLASTQISQLNSELIIAKSRRAEAEARLREAEQLAATSRGADSLSQILSSPMVQELRAKEGALVSESAQLSKDLGPKHPRLIAIRAEISDLRQKISAEVDKILAGLRSEVQVARAREESLRSSLAELERRAGQLGEKEVQLRALEREAAANRALLDSFLTRSKEISGQDEIQTPDAQVISYASVPERPSFPRRTPIIAAVAGVSAVFALLLVFLIERLDAGFRSMGQVEKLAGVPALTLVPALDAGHHKGPEPHDYVLEKPASAFAEAVRTLHVSLSLADVDNPPKIILMTSSRPGEGKSSLSLALGRLVARTGQKVVIIDCDLRRSVLHRLLKLPAEPGLVELLAGKASLAETIRKDQPSGADIIAAGGHAPNPADLLGSHQMKYLAAQLSNIYDFVVLDCPPVLAVTDARVLAPLADKTVFVVQWAKTRRDAAMFGLKQLIDAGASLAGIALSKVDVKKHARYGFVDSGYYHGEYAKYYTT